MTTESTGDFVLDLLDQLPELDEWADQQVRARMFSGAETGTLNPFQSDEVWEEWRRNTKADLLIKVLCRFGIIEPTGPDRWQVSPSATREGLGLLFDFLTEEKPPRDAEEGG